MTNIIALTLALLLIATGQSMAVARGATGPAGEVVLCTGTGPVVVLVDEDGNPVAPPHYCPDCALSLLDTIRHDEGLVRLVTERCEPFRAREQCVVLKAGAWMARARAPPALV